MSKKIYPSDLRREQFEKVREILESSTKKTKPRKYDLYNIFNAINYVLKTGCQYDAGKKVSGIKRHIAVDTQGFPHAIAITTANISDRDGAILMFSKEPKKAWRKVEKVLCDGGYRGEKFAKKILEKTNATAEVVKRNEVSKFEVIPKRWIVERSFAWLEKCRKLWKNAEYYLNSSLAMVQLAFILLLLKRS